jgi:hypothetical protein
LVTSQIERRKIAQECIWLCGFGPTQPDKIFIICVPRLTQANRRRYFYLFLKITWKGKRNNKTNNFHTWMLVVMEVTFSN